MDVEQLTWQIFRSTGNIGVYMFYRACSCCDDYDDGCEEQIVEQQQEPQRVLV